jgi:hypothetical protein
MVARAGLRAAAKLVAQCSTESSMSSPPFAPWVRALRDCTGRPSPPSGSLPRFANFTLTRRDVLISLKAALTMKNQQEE